jgi:hypothetical protein
MRLIQFNSGLCVVLKDVQHHQAEHSQGYYLTVPPPAHHSSDSSITTTSSSVKSNESTGINNGYYAQRSVQPPSHSTTHHQYNQVKTPSVIDTIPSTIVVEVGISIFTINTSSS